MPIEADLKKEEALPLVDVGSRYTVNLSEAKMKELGDYLKIRFQKIQTFIEQSGWQQEKAAAFRAYHLIPPERTLPFSGAANFPCPLPRIGVDAFHANVMSSLFARGNRMRLSPVITQKDYASTAKKAAKYMEYVVNDESDFYAAMDAADLNAEIYGVGYLEPAYIKEENWETVDVTETKRQPAINPQTMEVELNEVTTTRREKKKKTVFDGIKVNSIPVESVLSSPFLLTLEQAVRDDVVFKKFSMNYDALKDRARQRKNGSLPIYKESQVNQLGPYVTNKIWNSLSLLEQEKARQDGFFMDAMERMERLDLAEAHLWWDVDGDDIKEEITATFHPDSAVVLRVSLAPCRIVELVPRPVDGRFLGHGIPKICKPVSEEWQVFHNVRADAGQWENMPFFFYRAGGRFNPGQITLIPGHGHPVADPREVVFPQTQRVGQSYFEEEKMIVGYFERIFALDENMQGVGANRRRTATESINVANRSSVRFQNPFNRIASQVNKLITHMWELNRECAPPEKEFYILGSDEPVFDRMQKYDYAAKLKFSVEVSSVFDQQLIRDTALLAYRLFIVNPYVQQHPETLWELSQKTLDVLEVDVELPKPDQANTLSPFEEHELFKRGEAPEPVVGENADHHLKVHMGQLNAETIKEWDTEAVKALILHIDKTRILKQTLESANLNRSGIFDGAAIPGKQPGVTANRNPTQRFNTMRVGESANSASNNAAQPGGGREEALTQALGPI